MINSTLNHVYILTKIQVDSLESLSNNESILSSQLIEREYEMIKMCTSIVICEFFCKARDNCILNKN